MSWQSMLAQEGWENVEDRVGQTQFNNIELKEGIYRTFEEFKSNTPFITEEFELRTKYLFLKDTGNKWVQVNEGRIWGCFKDGKIYISKDEGLWRCINIGRLLQFATIKIERYVDPNLNLSIGGAGTMQEKSITKQYFLDTELGEVFTLNSRNFAPYAAQEPDLKTFKSKNKNKVAQTILLLKAYNELNPLKLKPNE
ncbi:MAG: hypothetical protein ACJASF_002144 [Vicingaceae bacterium]|jgi:hypothetical protein